METFDIVMTPRMAGSIGLLGALLMFAGDMLLYGHFGGGAEFLNAHKNVTATASLPRLMVAGIITRCVMVTKSLPRAQCAFIKMAWRGGASKRRCRDS